MDMKKFCLDNQLPTSYDYYQSTKKLPGIPKQTDKKMCIPLAAADLLTICLYRRRELRHPLSPQQLLDHCQNYGDINQVFAYLRNKGITTLDQYPFIAMSVPGRTDDDHEYKRHKLPGFANFDSNVAETIVKKLIETDRPVLGEMYVNDARAEFRDWKKGSAPFRPPPTTAAPDHAAVIVGYDFTSDDAGDHSIRIKNTLGNKWGDGGYGDVAPSSFARVWVPLF